VILELFITLLGISCVGLFLGYYTNDPHYAIVGLFFLFVLGGVLLTNNVEFESGSVITTNYTYVGGTVNASSTVITYQNSPFAGANARIFGLFLSLAAGAGIALVLFNFRVNKRDVK
jgi:hypothetical protein